MLVSLSTALFVVAIAGPKTIEEVVLTIKKQGLSERQCKERMTEDFRSSRGPSIHAKIEALSLGFSRMRAEGHSIHESKLAQLVSEAKRILFETTAAFLAKLTEENENMMVYKAIASKAKTQFDSGMAKGAGTDLISLVNHCGLFINAVQGLVSEHVNTLEKFCTSLPSSP